MTKTPRNKCAHENAGIRHHSKESGCVWFYECRDCNLHSDYRDDPTEALITWRAMLKGIEENRAIDKRRRENV
jgi:hypothetical protein